MSYTYIPAHGPEYAILVGYYYYLLVICDAWVTSCDSHGLRSSSYGPLDFQYKYYAGVCNTHRHCVCVSVWLCVLCVCVCLAHILTVGNTAQLQCSSHNFDDDDDDDDDDD